MSWFSKSSTVMVCGITIGRGIIMSGGTIITSGHDIITIGAITITDRR